MTAQREVYSTLYITLNPALFNVVFIALVLLVTTKNQAASGLQSACFLCALF